MKRRTLVAFSCTLVLLTGGILGCSGDDDGAVPRKGLWTGDKMQFFVSADGSKLTASGSPLSRGAFPCSMIAGSRDLTIETCFGADIPIVDGKFTIEGGGNSVSGKFSSSSSAKGDFTLAPPGAAALNSDWTATAAE